MAVAPAFPRPVKHLLFVVFDGRIVLLSGRQNMNDWQSTYLG